MNLRQIKLLKLLKDYEMSILYHLGNDNVVVDALNLMTMCIVYRVEEGKKDLVKDVHWLA